MNIPLKTNLRQRDLIFIDLETTGLLVQKHEIIEIGAIKVSHKRPFKVLAQFEVKVKPKRLDQADKNALKIVGFTETEWVNAVDLKKALQMLDNFGQDGLLVGYNVNFDWAVLDRAYFNLGRVDPFYYHRLDVMPMAYVKLFGKRSLKRFSLGEICKYLKIKRETEHRALSDAKDTYQVFKKLMDV